MATAAGIRGAVAKLLVGVVTGKAGTPEPPHCGDWRALAAGFHEAGVQRGLVRPRTLAQYVADERHAPQGHHPAASPAGLFALHLFECDDCIRTESNDEASACSIHTACALMEGVWPVWGPEGAPGAPRGPPPLPHASEASDLCAEDAAFAAESLNTLVREGCGEWVDASQCHSVTSVWVVHSRRDPLSPSAIAACGQPDAPLDMSAIAAAAQADGEAEGAAFISRASGATPDSAAGRAALHAAWRAGRSNGETTKRRIVERLDLTVNTAVAHMGVRFAKATDVLVGARDGDDLMADDGVAAYRSVPVTPELARHMAVQCPVSRRVFRPTRLPFGYKQSCAAYSVMTAVIKAAIGAACQAHGGARAEVLTRRAAGYPPLARVMSAITSGLVDAAQEGRLSTSGIVDDIFGRHPRALRGDIDALRAAAFSTAGYTRAPHKHRVGAAATILGLRACVAGDGGAPTVSIEAAKLYHTLRDVSKWVTIGAAGGCVPVKDHERLVGDVGWLAQVDAGTALRIHGARAGLARAQARKHCFVPMGHGAPSLASLRGILQRYTSGHARASAVVSAATALQSFRVSARTTSAGLQARASIAGAASYASDAALDAAGVKWALVQLGADGQYTATSGSRAARPGESSMSAELEAVREGLVPTFPQRRGTTIVLLMDSLCAVLALLKARARFGTPAFAAIQDILLAAEAHGIELLPIWIPRTLNTLADLHTHPSPSQ